MPVVPPTGPSVYDSVNSILNATRLRLHHRMPSLVAYSGSVLNETQASTQQALNNAYRKLQAVMANAGSSTFEQSIVIEGIPKVSQSALDPATECWISWFGCSDGVNQYTSPTLPADLMTPLWMSERWNGSNQPFPSPRTPNMQCCVDGIPKYRKTNSNGCWQWRGEVIYYPGSFQTEDFWIYYQAYLPDIIDAGNIRWFQQNVRIMRCQDALSCWLCREFCMSMSNEPELTYDLRLQLVGAVAGFESEAMAATRLLVSPDKKRKQRTNYSRLPFAGGGQGSGGGGIGSGGIGPAFTG